MKIYVTRVSVEIKVIRDCDSFTSPSSVTKTWRGTGGRSGRTGEGRGREAGAEIKKAIVCCLLLNIIQSKTLT